MKVLQTVVLLLLAEYGVTSGSECREGLSYGADVHVTANCSTFSPVATYVVTGYSAVEFVTALGTVSIEYNCTNSAHVLLIDSIDSISKTETVSETFITGTECTFSGCYYVCNYSFSAGYLCEMFAIEPFTCTVDIDECISGEHDCDANAECINTVGSFMCKCVPGYEGNGTKCTNIDECSGEIHNCSQHAVCTDTEGSYNCSCDDGFYGDGYNCTNVNECMNSSLHNCSEDATCIDTDGGYNCTCGSGYEGDGFNCTNIDECAVSDANNCSQHATCTDSDGSYSCTCDAGFEGSGLNCTNIDECTDGVHNCNESAECVDSEGGYNCTCSSGYQGDGFNCTDIDECLEGSHNCSQHAVCANSEGAYKCMCNFGFTGNGFTCFDIDECAEGHNCSRNAFCMDTEGSYNCSCNPGFYGDGFTCENIDECRGGHNCSENATCTDTHGSYSCTCNPGYQGTGIECLNMDECMMNLDILCHQMAHCIDTHGNYTCVCQLGYSGDGYSCTNINECADDIHNCDSNAICTDVEGSYICTCKDGYSGNGVTCTNIRDAELWVYVLCSFISFIVVALIIAVLAVISIIAKHKFGRGPYLLHNKRGKKLYPCFMIEEKVIPGLEIVSPDGDTPNPYPSLWSIIDVFDKPPLEPSIDDMLMAPCLPAGQTQCEVSLPVNDDPQVCVHPTNNDAPDVRAIVSTPVADTHQLQEDKESMSTGKFSRNSSSSTNDSGFVTTDEKGYYVMCSCSHDPLSPTSSSSDDTQVIHKSTCIHHWRNVDDGKAVSNCQEMDTLRV